MGKNEEATLRALSFHRKIIDDLIYRFRRCQFTYRSVPPTPTTFFAIGRWTEEMELVTFVTRLPSFTLLRKLAVVTEIESRQALMRERKDFDLAALFDWSVFAATRDSGELFKPETFEILPSDQWPARKSSLG